MDKFYFWSIIVFVWASAFLFVESKIGGLEPEEVSDGYCDGDIPIFQDMDMAWFLKTRNYYVPMGGKSLYRRFAKIFLGRPAHSQSNLNSVNLRMSWAAYGLTASGYDNKNVAFGCNLYNPEIHAGLRVAKARCKAVTSQGNVENPIDSFVITSVMWHKRYSVLVVTCSMLVSQESTELPIKDYFVVSTRPTLTSDTVKIYRKKLTELGFNLTNIQFLSYTKQTPVEVAPVVAGTDDIDLSDTPIG